MRRASMGVPVKIEPGHRGFPTTVPTAVGGQTGHGRDIPELHGHALGDSYITEVPTTASYTGLGGPIERAVARREVEVAIRIGRRRSAALPDTTQAAVRCSVEHG